MTNIKKNFQILVASAAMLLPQIGLSNNFTTGLLYSKEQLKQITPATELRKWPVFHKKLLENNFDQLDRQTLLFSISSVGNPSFTQDGRWMVYLNAKKQLVLKDLLIKSEKVLRENVTAQKIELIGNKTFFLTKDMTLIDWNGRLVHQWERSEKSLKILKDSHGVNWLIKQTLVDNVKTGDFLCAGAVLYDDVGEIQQKIELPKPVDYCVERVIDEATLEMLAIQHRTVAYYINNRKITEFKGVKFAKGEKVDYEFVDYLPFLKSSNAHGDKSLNLWSLNSGKNICQIEQSLTKVDFINNSDQQIIFASNPPRRINLPNCDVAELASAGSVIADDDLYWIYNPKAREVRAYDMGNGKLRYRLSVSEQYDGIQLSRVHYGNISYLILNGESFDRNSTQSVTTEVFDLERASIVKVFRQKQFSELLPLYRYMAVEQQQAAYNKTSNEPKNVENYFFIRIDGHTLIDLITSDYSGFQNALLKDRFETSEEFAHRIANLTLPYVMEVISKDYDADNEYFLAEWRGVQLGIPVPIDQARQLGDALTFKLSGQLRPIDQEFLLLVNGVITLPSGEKIPLSSANELFANTDMVTVDDAKSVGSEAETNSKPSNGIEVTATPGVISSVLGQFSIPEKAVVQLESCNKVMMEFASQLRVYSDPVLQKRRDLILGLDLKQELQSLSQQGMTREKLQLKSREFRVAAQEAALRVKQSHADLDETDSILASIQDSTLALDWSCEGDLGVNVCNYILNSWGEMVNSRMSQMVNIGCE